MSKKKKITVNQPINPTGKMITAGDIIGLFDGMDPNTPVAEGSLTISLLNSTNNEDTDMNVDYACDCGCNCDTCDCDDNQKYGDRTSRVMNLANMYNSGDFVQDTTDMDTDFAKYLTTVQINTSNEINSIMKDAIDHVQDVVANASMDLIDNLVSYQNTKNLRTEQELEVVARRIK